MNSSIKASTLKMAVALAAVVLASVAPARADGPADHQERRYVHVIDGGGPGCMALTENTPNHNGGCFNVPSGATTISLSLKDDFESITGATDSQAYISIYGRDLRDYQRIDACNLPTNLALPTWAYQVAVQLDQWATSCGQLVPPRVITGILSADFGH